MSVRSVTSIWLTLLLEAASMTISAPAFAECPLSKIVIVAGMPRSEVEAQVAKVLVKPSNYSTIANNLAGGIVEYRQKECELKVTYHAGAPAPLISTPSGSVQHLAPKDETVATYKFYALPLPARGGASGGSTE